MTEREFEMETEDGCTWSISWFRDASAFFVDVWDWAPYDELGGTADPDPECTCPFPILGVYDTLETVELTMGMKIPATVREALLRTPAALPSGRRTSAVGDASGRPRSIEQGRTGRSSARSHRRGRTTRSHPCGTRTTSLWCDATPALCLVA